MKAAIPSVLALAIVAVLAYFHDWQTQAPVAAPVIGPFAYADAVMPSFVPTPKPRPRHHRRHRFAVCKPPLPGLELSK
jgi:hypothetical protein